MSLVHEALRKAEREKQRKAGAAPNATPSSRQTVTLQPVSTPVVHAPVVTMPIAPLTRPIETRQTAPVAEKPLETNHFLLPALIGCVAIVAIIAIVFLVSNASSVLRQSRESAPVPATAAAPASVAKSTVPAEPQPTAQPPSGSATPATVTPPTAPTIDESKYKLSGIMKDPDGKYVAVLDGRVVYEGYYIEGATVEKIESNRVTLDVNGQKVVRRLF
jgi:hypothetical protein